MRLLLIASFVCLAISFFRNTIFLQAFCSSSMEFWWRNACAKVCWIQSYNCSWYGWDNEWCCRHCLRWYFLLPGACYVNDSDRLPGQHHQSAVIFRSTSYTYYSYWSPATCLPLQAYRKWNFQGADRFGQSISPASGVTRSPPVL